MAASTSLFARILTAIVNALAALFLPRVVAAPSAPTFILRNGAPGMSNAYLTTVNPPASRDPSAVKLSFTYQITPAGGQPGTAATVDATTTPPQIGLNPGDALSGSYQTSDANGVTSPVGPAASVLAPVAPAAPTFALANAPAST